MLPVVVSSMPTVLRDVGWLGYLEEHVALLDHVLLTLVEDHPELFGPGTDVVYFPRAREKGAERG